MSVLFFKDAGNLYTTTSDFYTIRTDFYTITLHLDGLLLGNSKVHVKANLQIQHILRS